MTTVDPTARVASGAALGKDVFVGPYCVIGPPLYLIDWGGVPSEANG